MANRSHMPTIPPQLDRAPARDRENVVSGLGFNPVTDAIVSAFVNARMARKNATQGPSRGVRGQRKKPSPDALLHAGLKTPKDYPIRGRCYPV